MSGSKVIKKISFEDISASHNYPASEIDILKKEFEYNLKVRSSSESIPLARIYQQKESKIYVKASNKGFSDQEIASNLKTFQSKKSSMYFHQKVFLILEHVKIMYHRLLYHLYIAQ